MSNPETASQPEAETFAHQEMIQFADGGMALGFRTDGDRVVLGSGSKHKYARHLDSDMVMHGGDGNIALITTELGARYVAGNGVVVYEGDDGHRAVWRAPETIDATIGAPAVIDGVGTTSNVANVLLRYPKNLPDGMVDHLSEHDDPFPELVEMVIAESEALAAKGL